MSHTSHPLPAAVRAATTSPGRLSTLALSIALALGAAPQTSHAQEAQVTIRIDAQPLGNALVQLATAYGLELAYSPDIVRGLSAPALSGNLNADQALDRLLAGSSITYRRTGRNVALWQVLQSNSAQPGTLPEVVVIGTAWEATSNSLTEGTGSFTTAGPVTAATGMNLTLRETPQSLTVITRERMDQQQLNSMKDVLDQTPGVFITQNSTHSIGGSATLSSRGFALDNYQVDGALTSGAVWNNTDRGGFTSLDSAIYDSVTVVRGATGLLMGAGDPGGSITLTRKRPTREFQGAVEVGAGRWDRYRGVLDLGGPLNEAGTLRGRLVGSHLEEKTWLRGYKGEQSNVYGVLDADLSDKTVLSLALEHTQENSNGSQSHMHMPIFFRNKSGLTPFGRHDSMLLPWQLWDVDRTTLSASLEHEFNPDWNLKLTYSRTEKTTKEKRGYFDGSITADYLITGIRRQKAEADSDADGIDVKLNGKFDLFGRKHDLMAGFNISRHERKTKESRSHYLDSSHGAYVVNGVALVPEPDWSSRPNNAPYVAKDKQQGLFLATRLRPTDALALILGGRWSSWDTKSTDLPGYPGYDPSTAVYGDRKYSNVFTPYAGVVYDFTKNLSAYGSVTEIFQPQYNKDVTGKLLDPEEGISYELGLKGEWFDGRLNASVAAFDTRKENLAVWDDGRLTPEGDQAYRAEDDTKTRGWELEVSGELAPGWQLQAGYSRAVRRDSEGKRLNESMPVHQVKLFTSYTPSSVQRLTVGGGVNWRSKSSDVWEGEESYRDYFTIKPYAVVNLMANYAFTNKLSLSVNLNNAFNKNYRVGHRSHAYGAERNLSASLRYRF